jgi:tetratricopeptide (TPR) repeat protein
MGVVYLARQISLNRLVALKTILAGPYAGPEEVARFRTEAEAVARLQHPNIVQIYEVGEHDGRPYLTLELVDGIGLDRRLRESPLAARAAAELLQTLARAVQAAHERGIVHRDLKPANVLLSADGTPKVSDFGLAKRLADADGDAPTPRTRTGALLGTPNYMAPEQAAGAKDVGPAADVYALGAILYECLTGRPPFQAATVLETLEQVRFQEPVPLGRLQPHLPRDLQTVCHKCLQKDPRRRYASAAELADDLRRFLAGEPVRARPVSARERLAKWVRRRPTAAALVAVSGLAALVLLLGLLGHNARLQREVRRAEAGEGAAQRQHRRADADYRQARQALEKMLGRLDDKRLAEVPRLRELREGLLEDALAFYQGALENLDEPNPAVRLDTAVAHLQVGKIRYLLGRPEAARAAFDRARDLLEGLAAERPDDLQCRLVLSDCYVHLGAWGGRPDEAEGWLQKAVALREQLHRARPQGPDWAYNLAAAQNTLAGIYQEGRRRDRAAEHYAQALALYERLQREYPENVTYRKGLANTSCNLALLHYQQGRRDKAEEVYRNARSLLEPLLAGREADPDFLYSLTAMYVGYGDLLKDTGRRGDALALYTRGVELLKPVYDREPRHVGARDSLLRCHGARAMAYYEAGRYPESAADWGRVIELAPEAARPRYHYCRANTWHQARECARAAADVKAVGDRPGFAPLELTTMACICSAYVGAVRKDARLAGAERDRLAEEYGARAVALLRKAHAAGLFKDRSMVLDLECESDLIPIRSRADFRQLWEEIQGKKK